MYKMTKKIEVDLPPLLKALYPAGDYMILDIETTGLSRDYTEVILVGIIYKQAQDWMITQIFCDNRKEEKELLLSLMTYIHKNHLLITYNGHAFDIPYLNRRYEVHGIDFRVSPEKHFDLYRVVRASKKALGLPNYKLKSIETFLGIHREDEISGKESVELYEHYEYMPSKALRNKICLHNYEDILLMVPTLKILDHIPKDICLKYYPLSTDTLLGKCFLLAYKETRDYLEISAYTDKSLRPLVDYRMAMSFETKGHIMAFKIPIFHIDDHTFIDIDLMPIYPTPFNDLPRQAQIDLKFSNQKDSFEKTISCLNKYYFKALL